MRKNSREFTCRACGKGFSKPVSRARSRNVQFCRRDCMWKYRRAHPEEFRRSRVEYTCDFCGKKKSRCASLGAAKFCSQKCYHKSRSAARRAAEPDCRRCGKPLFSPHISESGLCLGCWRKHAGEEGLCFKPKLNGWSWRHGACVRCLDTSSPHKTRGVCSRCYSKEQGSRRRGSWGKKCLICGEARAIARCHIVPKRLGGPVDGWNVLYLCATHHHCFDEDELTDAEWEKIKRKVRLALGRVDLSGVKRYGRQGLPWALRRIA